MTGRILGPAQKEVHHSGAEASCGAALLAKRLDDRAALGDLATVTAMLDQDPGRIRQARPWGKRPLSAAVQFGHDRVAQFLLERGADPNWPEGSEAPRGSALHTAARLGNRAMVELLLDHGADPNAHVDSSGSATWAAATPELR